jgi:lysophospholipase L1-like esterase
MGHNDLMHDTIHPNAAGYKIMARRFHKAIEPYL